jgi:L-serine dehydratase
MRTVGILNEVLGPVMRGPSSSHTAGSFHIGRMARDLLRDYASPRDDVHPLGEPASVSFVFDPGGSLVEVYRQQGGDLAFTAGLLGLSITDEAFIRALDLAAERGLDVTFQTEPLPEADHPNAVEIRMSDCVDPVARDGRQLSVSAQSIGGGAVVLTRVGSWPVCLTGDAYEILVVTDVGAEVAVRQLLVRAGHVLEEPTVTVQGGQALLHVRRGEPLDSGLRSKVARLPGVHHLRTASPVFFVRRGGEPLFSSAARMVSLADERALSLGQLGLAYESALLGLPEDEVLAEVVRRFDVMQASVHRGLEADLPPMQLLRPSARQIYRAEVQGRVAAGGMHTRAAARAMAVMHVNGGMGVICAAPTAGSAGVIPGTVVTMAEEWGLDRREAALALLAAAAIGLVVGARATFAAEVAGCQVEIGAAGAMAAAAVVEVAGGTAQQAANAAAIALQNTMGSICDMVQGVVEIPCHTRNAVASSSAFVCADLVLGGYVNPIPLDETVDAVYATGQVLPRELKCTALGGLAVTPSARAMPRLR